MRFKRIDLVFNLLIMVECEFSKFSQKKRGVCNIGGIVLKKKGI